MDAPTTGNSIVSYATYVFANSEYTHLLSDDFHR
jgi:hypothetical protein